MYEWCKYIMMPLCYTLSLQWFAAQGPPEPAVFALCLVVPCEFVSWLFELLQCPVAVSSMAELCSTFFILHLLVTCLFHWVPIASAGRNSERSFLFTWCSWICISVSHFFPIIFAVAWRNLIFLLWEETKKHPNKNKHEGALQTSLALGMLHS